MEDARVYMSAAWKFLQRRKRSYMMIPDEVVKDLNKYCRGNATTFNADPRVQAFLEGRRDVLLRILHHRNEPTEALFTRYGGVVQTGDE